MASRAAGYLPWLQVEGGSRHIHKRILKKIRQLADRSSTINQERDTVQVQIQIQGRTTMAKTKVAKAEKTEKVKKVSKKEVAEQPASRKAIFSISNDQTFQDKVVSLRESGAKWGDIATQTNVSVGRVQLAFLKASGGTETPTPKSILAARSKEGASWGTIMAKFNVTEGQARKLFVEAGGDLSEAIPNRAGRKVGGSGTKASKAAKAEAKAESKPKKSKKGKFVITPDMDDEAVVSIADGRKLTWTQARTGAEATAKVKPGSVDVKAGKNGKRILSFNDGSKSRSIDIASITKVG